LQVFLFSKHVDQHCNKDPFHLFRIGCLNGGLLALACALKQFIEKSLILFGQGAPELFQIFLHLFLTGEWGVKKLHVPAPNFSRPAGQWAGREAGRTSRSTSIVSDDISEMIFFNDLPHRYLIEN
jgi:hypothetical protein